MNMSNWQPHGLVRYPYLEAPYRDKKTINEHGNEIDPKVHFTIHQFEDSFNRVVFPEDEFFVNPRVPPASNKGSEKACDLAVSRVIGNFTQQIFCFCEDTHAKIRDLEAQSHDYCHDFLEAYLDTGIDHGCTFVGASI